MWPTLFSRPRRALGGLLLVALVLTGCQGGKKMGTVSGKVTYKGNPVTAGEVQFTMPEKGLGSSAKLDDSGAYTLAGQLEAGTYKVYIQPPTPEQLPPGQAPKPVKFDVPRKFQNLTTTPLTKEVKAGANDIPIELD